MAKDFDDAYEVETGLNLGGQGGIFMGTQDPWLEPILNAPIGSRYWKLSIDDEQFRKIGAGDTETDWRKISRSDLGAPPLTLSWSAFSAKQLDYLDIGKITSSKVAHSVPFNTSVINLTVSYDSVGTGGATVELWVDDTYIQDLGALVEDTVPGVQNFILSPPRFINELSRIQLRMAAGSATVSVMVANLIMEDFG